MKGKALVIAALAALAIGTSSVAGASTIDVRIPDWGSSDTDGPSADSQTPAAAPASTLGAEMGLAVAVINSSVPEVPIWAMLLLGFAGLGLGIRRQRSRAPRLRTDDAI